MHFPNVLSLLAGLVSIYFAAQALRQRLPAWLFWANCAAAAMNLTIFAVSIHKGQPWF